MEISSLGENYVTFYSVHWFFGPRIRMEANLLFSNLKHGFGKIEESERKLYRQIIKIRSPIINVEYQRIGNIISWRLFLQLKSIENGSQSPNNKK